MVLIAKAWADTEQNKLIFGSEFASLSMCFAGLKSGS